MTIGKPDECKMSHSQDTGGSMSEVPYCHTVYTTEDLGVMERCKALPHNRRNAHLYTRHDAVNITRDTTIE